MIGARQLVNLAPSISGGRVGTTRATRYQLTGPNRRVFSQRVRAAEEATPTSESGPVKAVEHTPKPVQNVEAIAENPPPYASKLSGFKVLVAGATGKTGKCVVESLRAYKVPVTALVRSKTKAESSFKGMDSEDLKVVEGDVFQFSTLPKAFTDANALIICTGASNSMDPLGPFNTDFQGTLNLLALAKQNKMKKVVLVSSIGADTLFNLLNLFWGVLFWKKRAEEAIQRSGIEYTIVRPGGLKSKLESGKTEGSIVMKGAGYYGVPPTAAPGREAGSILRKQVAEVCVAALVEASATNKVVEIIACKDAPKMNMEELFASVE